MTGSMTSAMINTVIHKYGLEAPETIAFCDIIKTPNVKEQTIITFYSVLMSIDIEDWSR